jgi:hypothetical protein
MNLSIPNSRINTTVLSMIVPGQKVPGTNKKKSCFCLFILGGAGMKPRASCLLAVLYPQFSCLIFAFIDLFFGGTGV